MEMRFEPQILAGLTTCYCGLRGFQSHPGKTLWNKTIYRSERIQTLEDIYIEMLRYGKEHLADGVTSQEMLSYLQELQPELGLVQGRDSVSYTFEQAFPFIGGALGGRRFLGMEGYFNLLEHDELQEARKSSRNALRVAVVAIVISGTLAAVSVYLQLSSSVNFWPNA